MTTLLEFITILAEDPQKLVAFKENQENMLTTYDIDAEKLQASLELAPPIKTNAFAIMGTSDDSTTVFTSFVSSGQNNDTIESEPQPLCLSGYYSPVCSQYRLNRKVLLFSYDLRCDDLLEDPPSLKPFEATIEELIVEIDYLKEVPAAPKPVFPINSNNRIFIEGYDPLTEEHRQFALITRPQPNVDVFQRYVQGLMLNDTDSIDTGYIEISGGQLCYAYDMTHGTEKNPVFCFAYLRSLKALGHLHKQASSD